MEYFKISLRPHKAIVNAEYCESLIYESFNILRKTGQVYENFQVVREAGQYAVYVIMPGADALNLEFCSDESVEYVRRLAAIFALKVESLGACITCEDSCTCEKSSWYMLYTDFGTPESPLICGDCGKPVPIYKLPEIPDAEGQSRILNWQEQFQAMQKLGMFNYDTAYTDAQLYGAATRLNKMGRSLCKTLEKATSIPVFYHLEQNKAEKGAACPICGSEWSRTANAELAGNLCTHCRIAVD